MSFVAAASPPFDLARAAPQDSRPPYAVEFPTFDSAALQLVTTGLRAKETRERAKNLDDPEVALLLAQTQPAESLRFLRQFIDRHPEQIASVFKNLFGIRYNIDQSRSYEAEFAEIVGLARAQLKRLPREEAATAARVLLSLEAGLDRSNPRRQWADWLKEFVTTYAGTQAAVLAEVDMISAGPMSMSRLDALDEIARKNPGTVVAAKALYQKAFDLGHNAMALRLERPGADPTSRFLQVAAIAKDLEGGRYPKCEWTEQAPKLVIEFFSYQPKYSPENIDVMLNGYREFVGSHLAPGSDIAGSSLAYVISRKMADLFALRGDRIAGVERLLTDLAGKGGDAGEIETFRAAFYIQQLFEPSDRPDELLKKALDTLRGLQAGRREPYARRASATIAALHFFERDYPAARQAYATYLSTYPKEPWSWVAALRLGQSSIAIGDLNRAAAAFIDVSAQSDLAVARVLGHAYAADVLAGLGQPDNALKHARQALAGWDDDFGIRYRVQAQQRRLPTDEPFGFADDMTVAKEYLPTRIAELERSAGHPAGALVEQGRWLIAREKFDDAKKVLERAMVTARRTPLEGAARTLFHRASLERALILADAANTTTDRPAALQALETLAAEPLDFPVFAGRLAAATIVFSQDAADAETRVASALTEWRARQPLTASPPASSLEADVAAIRAEVFRPMGGGIYAQQRWNAFEWPTASPRFMLVSPDITVNLERGDVRLLSLRVPIRGLDNIIFTDRGELAVLATMMRRLGGTARREPTEVMQTPNQPAGAAVDIRALWNRFFPARPGHWSGWVFETYPIITDVTFHDIERTRASVRVQVGYSGGTVVLVKEKGVWIARELTNLWIT